MKQQAKKHNMDGAFVLLVFTVFAACILMVLLTGAGAFRRISARDGASYDRRVGISYLAAKVRHADTADGVFVGDFDGGRSEEGDTLFLTEKIDGELYDTRIYYYDGYVRELFAAADGDFSPADGEPVLPAESLTFHLEDGLLSVQTTDGDGAPSQLTLSLRSDEGAGS